MAPEQVEGRPIDGRADLYALACSAFEMLAGTPPFKRDEGVAVLWAQLSAPTPSLQAIRPELPSAVDQVMGRALAKSPGDRYQACTAFAAALRAACGLGASDAGPGHLPVAAPPSWPPTEKAHVYGQPTSVKAAPTEPQPAAPASFPTAPQPVAPASYPAGPAVPRPGPHPSWPEGPPPGRYVVPPPAPGRYTAGTPAPRRRRSWTGALLIVACIVLLGIAGAVFAALRGHGTSTSHPPSPPPAKTTTGPAAVTSPPVNPVVPRGPAATVQAYVAAINAHDYAKAWDLGGNHTGQPYSRFVQGYNGTAHDDLTVLSVSGNVVTAQLTATQTDGTVKTYQGTYAVRNGVITNFDIRRTG
jgi:hypothetical protein